MREIKFRGKRLSDGEWCRGDLAIGEDKVYILSGWPIEAEKLSALASIYSLRVQGQINECDLKTVGQFTGLKDKNGKEIYELCELNGRYIVTYKPPIFVLYEITSGDIVEFSEQDEYEITSEYQPLPQNTKRGTD